MPALRRDNPAGSIMPTAAPISAMQTGQARTRDSTCAPRLLHSWPNRHATPCRDRTTSYARAYDFIQYYATAPGVKPVSGMHLARAERHADRAAQSRGALAECTATRGARLLALGERARQLRQRPHAEPGGPLLGLHRARVAPRHVGDVEVRPG